MLRLFFTASAIVIAITLAFGQTGEITGRVTDDSGEGIPFATISAMQEGVVVNAAAADFDGYYTIKPLEPGKYDVEVRNLGFAPKLNQGVVVGADRITELDVGLTTTDELIPEVEIIEYRVPLIDKESSSTKNTLDKEQIEVLPTRNVNSIASLSTNVYQEDEGGGLNIKGAREEGTEYYIDGMRVIGSASVPAQGIEQLTVLTGGVPAKYGDATGGIVTITTRGPSRSWNGSLEGATSSGMDAYGYNQASFNVSGPLVKKNKGTDQEKSIFGIFLAGEYVRHKDPAPPARGIYTAKDDVLEFLEDNPLVPSEESEAFIVTTETVTKDQLKLIDSRKNVVDNNYRLSGKFDIKASETINLTVGGTVFHRDFHDWVDRYSMFNYVNNPQRKSNTYRGFVRFTQRFQRAGDQETGSTSAFKNAFYSIQLDYSKVNNKRADDSHGTNTFDYGYLGLYDIQQTKIFDYGVDEVTGYNGWLQQGDQDTLVEFTPGTVNPNGTSFTTQYYELAGAEFIDGVWTAPFAGAQTGFYETLDQIQLRGGLLNGDRPRVPHDIWYNTGRQFNGYGVLDHDDQFRLNVAGSVDIGSARNKHGLEFGFEFEQRIERAYSVAPIGLWTLMRQLANRQIDQLDTDNPYLLIDGEVYYYADPNAPDFGDNDSILYQRKYVETDQTYFDTQLREKLGLEIDGTEWINTDNYGPDFYSLDMFSPDELLNDGNPYVALFGYDYLGNKFRDQPTFDDYFKEQDENGIYTRPIAAYRPIYTSVYVQDKFNFKDLLFNVGVRIDRFDANQKVLKDKYLLYQAYTVGESRDQLDGTVPDNIGDDYVVYVDNFNSENPVPLGYRDGDNWFTASGEQTNNPELIARGSATGQITPYLVDPNADIKSPDYEPSTSFEDYSPQLSVMPRLAFSFNITDEASFFAHYDILVQRPKERIISTPDDWYYFDQLVGTIINNPNLKPERTIDYQLGFRQLVSRNSAVTISAFYRDMKDMIQVENVAYAYPRDYITFGNIDIGTVKGFSVAFDLRRTPSSNFSMKANYTIQWAEGTGSTSTSQANLVRAGEPNLRTIVPLAYDSRHNINLTLDYTFGEGGKYNGPKVNGKNILENTGANITVRTRSGEPFTAQANPTGEAYLSQQTRSIIQGSINGSRLPWNVRVDFRIWKDFRFQNKEKTRRPVYLNVYLLIQNLLNTANVGNVYNYTGNADDDGYLASTLGQQDINGQENPESFVDLYSAFVNQGNNPSGAIRSNYSLPRNIRLGAIIKF